VSRCKTLSEGLPAPDSNKKKVTVIAANRDAKIGSSDSKRSVAGLDAAQGAVKKNPIESVVTTLPVIMLLGGLAFYFLNERRQVGGQILHDQIAEIDGEFSGISQQSDKPDAQRLLWIKTPSRLRGARVNHQQAQQLGVVSAGDPLVVWMAPKVKGSKILWLVKACSDGQLIVPPELTSEPTSEIDAKVDC